MCLNENMIPHLKENVRSRKEEFGLMIFTNRTPILSFNKDAAIIWEQINNQKTVREISDEIDKITSIENTQSTVIAFLQSCKDLDLIELKD